VLQAVKPRRTSCSSRYDSTCVIKSLLGVAIKAAVTKSVVPKPFLNHSCHLKRQTSKSSKAYKLWLKPQTIVWLGLAHPIWQTITELGICIGRAAHMGVWPRWAWAWPQAKISPPKHHLCPCLRLLKLYRFFFAHIDNFESLQRFPKWWIAFRLPCPLSLMLSHVSSAFSSWRLQNRAIFHIFSSTTDHLTSQQFLGPCEMSHWVGQEVVYSATPQVHFLIFSFFLFLC
jgi:hypothetical protein